MSHLSTTKESGSVLVLVPAAVLILVILGSIAVDSGTAFLGQRELAQAAQTAAENASDQLAPASFYGSGRIALDPDQAIQAAEASVSAQVLSGVTLDGPVEVTVSGARACVSLTGRVRVVFGSALPGVAHWIAVSAHSSATAAESLAPSISTQADC